MPRRLCALALALTFWGRASLESQRGPSPEPILGHISFPNSGAAAAQAPFIRGVLLMHSFEYDDAIAAFREAERIDPSFALAYWGEALAYEQPLWRNEDVAKARVALNKLAPTPDARAAKAPTAREKGYLDAVEKLFGTGSKATRDRAYAERMRQLARDNPTDDEAAAWLSLALLATIGENERNVAVSQEAGTIALGVLTRNPQHPGAAHYALHAFDDGEHAAMGLQAARTYAKIAPASSHARHMPSHVFLPLGMWDEAAASDESAFAASVDRAKRLGLSASQYDFHALGWLQYEYLQQGRFTKARELIATVERAVGEGSRAEPSPHHHVESEIGRGFGTVSLRSERASMRARLIVESGRWAEMKAQGSFDNVDELFALGIASVKRGDLARAEAAIQQLQAAQKAAPDATNRALAQVMTLEVGGLRDLAAGDRDGGLGALTAAAQLEAGIPKPIARPYPIKPATELYAEALLDARDAKGAIVQFQAALARTPRRAAALIGLARAFVAAGQPANAARTARDVLSMWHLADADRPEIAEMRRLAR